LATGHVADGPEIEELRARIAATVDVAEVQLCGSGSLALELALRTAGVGAGDEVVLPAFCCTAVVPPILALGATPVLADVGDELNLTVETVQAVLTRKTKAVIVPHLFGNPAEIDAVVDTVRGRNIFVIDDAAQALGATIDGIPVGGFGDAGIVSFGAEKVCSGLGGGVLVSRRDEVVRSAPELKVPASIPEFKKLRSTLFLRNWRRWTRPLGLALSPKSPDEAPIPYRREAMSNLAAAVASSLMRTLEENLAARRARVEVYRQLLGECAGVELIAHRAGSACLTQVVRVLPDKRDDEGASRVIEALGAAGYEVRGSYMPIHLLPSFERCVWDRLPHSTRVWADLVELPCEPGVGLADIHRIADLVKRIVNS
jgi:dTDP-4-amino-4,6-dideoxygalactose transaminase